MSDSLQDVPLGQYELDTVVEGEMTVVNGNLPEGSIDFAITSPPYYNARRDYSEWPTYEAYLSDVEKWLRAIFRVLKPGRRLAWQVSNIFEKDVFILPIPSDSMVLARKIGFIVRQELFWDDPAAGNNWLVGSFPHGPSVLLQQSVEHLLVLQKPGHNSRQTKYDKLPEELLPYDFMDTNFFRDTVSKNVWRISPVIKLNNKGENLLGHSAPFPEELVEPCIRMWSRPGEIVLDPFMGSGTTGRVALKWRRHFFGCDKMPEFVRLANKRIEERRVEIETEKLMLIPPIIANAPKMKQGKMKLKMPSAKIADAGGD